METTIDGNHHFYFEFPIIFMLPFLYPIISSIIFCYYYDLLWLFLCHISIYFLSYPLMETTIDGNHHFYFIFMSYLYHIYIIFISYYATIFGFSMVHKPSSWGSPIEAAPAHRLSGGLIRQHRTRRAVAAHGA